jgi:hypothetical protein
MLAVRQRCWAPLKITFPAAWSQDIVLCDLQVVRMTAGSFPKEKLVLNDGGTAAQVTLGGLSNWDASSLGLVVGFLQVECSQT